MILPHMQPCRATDWSGDVDDLWRRSSKPLFGMSQQFLSSVAQSGAASHQLNHFGDGCILWRTFIPGWPALYMAWEAAAWSDDDLSLLPDLIIRIDRLLTTLICVLIRLYQLHSFAGSSAV